MKFPNGYGSVICLGKKRRKPYAVRVTVDRVLYEKDGKLCSKQKYAYLGTFTTSKEAHMYLAEYNANRVDSDPVLVANMSLSFPKPSSPWPAVKRIMEKTGV